MVRISGLFRVRTGVWALALALSAAGCATTRYEAEESPPSVPDRRSSQTDSAVVQTPPAIVLVEIDSLKTLSFSQAQKLAVLEEINTELSDKVALLNDRIKALEDRVQALSSPPETAPPARPSHGGRKSARQFTPPVHALSHGKAAYQAALRDFEARRYEDALREFSEVLTAAPKDNLADNAQYWIGECYYGLGNYTQAIKEFQKVFAYPKTAKDDDAQLKIGLCYIKIGETDKAVVELKRLTVDYPESEYIERANALLRDLQAHKGQRSK